MKRFHVRLTEAQAAKVKHLAAERGVLVSELVRDAIDLLDGRDERAERFARAIAAIRANPGRDIDGKTDVAERHDEYLADIYETDLRR